MFDDEVDEQLRPDLAAQAGRAREQQTLTNRLYALTEFLSTRHPLPANERNDGVCPRSNALHAEAVNNCLQAVAAIANASHAWAAEINKPAEE